MFRYELPQESPGLLFWQTSTLWRRQINYALQEVEITHTQYVILAVIFFLKKEKLRTTQTAVSELSMIDNMTVSNTLRLLEKKELVYREEDSLDSRAKLINCTPAGEEKLKIAIELVEKIDEDFFDFSQKEGQQFANLLNMLKEKNKDWRKQ